VSIERLYEAVSVMRARDASPSREELDDAGVWASDVLGGEWVARLRACRPDDALEQLREACLAARTVWLEDLTSLPLADISAALALSPWVYDPSLQTRKCDISGKALDTLVTTPARLRVIDLGDTQLKPDQLAAICKSPKMATVERLNVSNNILRDEGLAHLGHTDVFSALRVLEASYTRATLAGIRAIANAKHLRPRALDLGTDKLGREFGEVLAKGSALDQLRGLSVYRQRLGGGGLAAIARSKRFELRTLRVMENRLGDKAVAALAAAPTMRRLRELRFHYDRIGGEALKAIAASPQLAALRRLQMSQCKIDAAGIRALTRSTTLTGLVELNLGTNPAFGPDVVRDLGESANFRELESLTLDGMKLGDDGLGLLADIETLPRLETLSIQNNDFTDAGLDALARWPQLKRLRSLDLGTNAITADGIARLLRIEGLRLEQLALWGTPAASDSKAIVKASRYPGIRLVINLWPTPWMDR
jgi:Ran GTPase-activating protein (RanGAP) involved in mRNA processing and transport